MSNPGWKQKVSGRSSGLPDFVFTTHRAVLWRNWLKVVIQSKLFFICCQFLPRLMNWFIMFLFWKINQICQKFGKNWRKAFFLNSGFLFHFQPLNVLHNCDNIISIAISNICSTVYKCALLPLEKSQYWQTILQITPEYLLSFFWKQLLRFFFYKIWKNSKINLLFSLT